MENIYHEEDRLILIHVVEHLHLPFLAGMKTIAVVKCLIYVFVTATTGAVLSKWKKGSRSPREGGLPAPSLFGSRKYLFPDLTEGLGNPRELERFERSKFQVNYISRNCQGVSQRARRKNNGNSRGWWE